MTLHLSGTVGGCFCAWPLDRNNLSIGRSSTNTIQILDPKVSRHHAVITLLDDHYVIRDLGSRNGTSVNGVEVHEAEELKPGDEVRFGSVSMQVTADSPRPPEHLAAPMNLSSSISVPSQPLLSPSLQTLDSVLAQRYSIHRELGRGGMSTVYLAHDLKHQRAVALKCLHRRLAAFIGTDLFIKEIRIMAALQHPHIVPIFDSGEAAGTLYYVMPYVEGTSLKERLDQEGKLPLAEVLQIAQQVLDALNHAHDKGVVHRDIKPANILLSDAHAFVADFGIAKAIHTAGGTALTGTGVLLGTPGYMSPEQVCGGKVVDGRTDLFGLGCVLYECLTGKRAFDGDNQTVLLAAVLGQEPDWSALPPETPPTVREFVVGCLNKDPSKRQATLPRSGLLGPTSTRTGAHQMISEAEQLLMVRRSLEETCGEILRIIERAIPASRLALFLQSDPGFDTDSSKSELVQVRALYPSGVASKPIVLTEALVHKVLDERTSVLTTDAGRDSGFSETQSFVAKDVRSVMAVPLCDNGTVLGVLYAEHEDPANPYGEEQLEALTVLANMAALKITNARLLEAERKLTPFEEVDTARRIQRGLLPGEPPQVAGYQFHIALETCEEVGGDFYDFHVDSSGQVYFVVGDVSGKGLAAAFLMSSVITSLRLLYDGWKGPEDVIDRLNAILCRSTAAKQLAGVFLASLEPTTGKLQYVNAGLPPPLVLSQGKAVPLLGTGIPLGALPDISHDVEEVTMGQGEEFALFTDGLLGVHDDSHPVGADRLIEGLLAGWGTRGPEERARAIVGDAKGFRSKGPFADDITLLLLHRF